MKYFYSLLFALLLTGSTYAQSAFVCTPSNAITTVIPLNTYTPMHMSMVNQTNDSLTLGWTRISDNCPAGWDYSLCDYTNCYVGVPASGTMNAIHGQINGFFTLTLNPMAIEATATIEIWVYDLDNPSDGDTVAFTVISNAAVGISSINLEDTQLAFPNPAVDFVNFNKATEEVLIYNINGSLVDQVRFASGQTQIDISSLPAAQYILRIKVAGSIYSKALLKQ